MLLTCTCSWTSVSFSSAQDSKASVMFARNKSGPRCKSRSFKFTGGVPCCRVTYLDCVALCSASSRSLAHSSSPAAALVQERWLESGTRSAPIYTCHLLQLCCALVPYAAEGIRHGIPCKCARPGPHSTWHDRRDQLSTCAHAACMHACINKCQVTTYRLFPLLLLSVVLTTTSQTSIPCSLSVWVY